MLLRFALLFNETSAPCSREAVCTLNMFLVTPKCSPAGLLRIKVGGAPD